MKENKAQRSWRRTERIVVKDLNNVDDEQLMLYYFFTYNQYYSYITVYKFNLLFKRKIFNDLSVLRIIRKVK